MSLKIAKTNAMISVTTRLSGFAVCFLFCTVAVCVSGKETITCMDAHDCNRGLHCDFYAGNSDLKAPRSFQRLLSLCR